MKNSSTLIFCFLSLLSVYLIAYSPNNASSETTTVMAEDAEPLEPINYAKKFSDLNVSEYQLSKESEYQKIIQKILTVKKLSPELQVEIIESILKISKKHQLNPIFLLAIAEVESSLNPNYAKDNKFGLIPLNESKASYVSKLYGIKFESLEDLKKINQNIELAGSYFGFLSEVHPQNYEHYALAYHWNSEAVGLFLKSSSGLPKEHQVFLNRVAETYKGFISSPSASLSESENKNIESLAKKDQQEVSKEESSSKLEKDIQTFEGKEDQDSISEEKEVDPILDITSSKPLPKYYLDSKAFLTEKAYYQLLFELALAEKINIIDPQKIINIVTHESMEAQIDPFFVFSLINNSSNFNAAQSLGGKLGLLQIGEEESKLAASYLGIPWPGKNDLLNPEINLTLGLAYLKICHNIFDNNSLHAIAGYRWGIKNLIQALKNKSEIPPLIIRYPQKILEDYKKYISNFKASSAKKSKGASNVSLNSVDPVQKLVCSASANLIDCKELASKIKKEANIYRIDPLYLAKYAQIKSNFKTKLVKNNRFGLFQWSPEEAEKIARYAKVAWAGSKELLNEDYAIRIACKYHNYLKQRFKGNEKLIAIGMFWDVDQILEAIRKKQTVPNHVNSAATQLLKKY